MTGMQGKDADFPDGWLGRSWDEGCSWRVATRQPVSLDKSRQVTRISHARMGVWRAMQTG